MDWLRRLAELLRRLGRPASHDARGSLLPGRRTAWSIHHAATPSEAHVITFVRRASSIAARYWWAAAVLRDQAITGLTVIELDESGTRASRPRSSRRQASAGRPFRDQAEPRANCAALRADPPAAAPRPADGSACGHHRPRTSPPASGPGRIEASRLSQDAVFHHPERAGAGSLAEMRRRTGQACPLGDGCA